MKRKEIEEMDRRIMSFIRSNPGALTTEIAQALTDDFGPERRMVHLRIYSLSARGLINKVGEVRDTCTTFRWRAA